MKKYALFTFDGQAFPLTEKEFEISRKQWLDGYDPIVVNGEPINAKNIARIGRHQTTPDIIKLEKANDEQYLRLNNPNKYKNDKDDQFKIAQERYKKNKEKIKSRSEEMVKIATGQVEVEKLEKPVSREEYETNMLWTI